MIRPPWLVFLVHAADRSGAAVTVLHQLHWLRQHTPWRLEVVLLRGGPLLAAFEAIGPTVVLGEPDLNPERTAEMETADEDRRRRLAHLAEVDLTYVNTAWSIHALPFLPDQPHRPVVAAIHELDHDLRDGMPAASLRALLTTPDHFVAGAEVIARNLELGYSVPRSAITVVPEAIPLPRRGTSVDRRALGLRDDDVVVTAAGSPIWRKGPDHFVHLAHRLRRRRPDLSLRLRWVGADESAAPPDLETPRRDRDRLALGGVVEFVPPTDRVLDHLRASDVFVLTSREDANPLVCLEAASVEVPVVCFDTGGTAASLGPDGCVEVAYPDLDAFTEAVLALVDDPATRRAHGQAAAASVRANHDIERSGPVLRDLLADHLPG